MWGSKDALDGLLYIFYVEIVKKEFAYAQKKKNHRLNFNKRNKNFF